MNLNVTIPSSIGDIRLKNPLMPAAATLGNLIEQMCIRDRNGGIAGQVGNVADKLRGISKT